MEATNTKTQEAVVDNVTQDFKNAVFVVSLFVNLVVFTTWVAVSLS